MADQTLNVDGNTPATVTAASKWFEASFVGVDFVIFDQYLPPTTTPGSKWFYGLLDPTDKALHVDGYIPGVVAGYVNAIAVGDERPVNFWTIVATSWTVTIYKMRGMDALTDGLYDTWLVEGEPDTDASEYAGALNAPLRDVIVIDTWSSSS